MFAGLFPIGGPGANECSALFLHPQCAVLLSFVIFFVRDQNVYLLKNYFFGDLLVLSFAWFGMYRISGGFGFFLTGSVCCSVRVSGFCVLFSLGSFDLSDIGGVSLFLKEIFS